MPQYNATNPYLISYGPAANCVLDRTSPYYCPLSWSVYGYLPALAASSTFIALYAIALAIHIYLGLRWRTWWFMGAMIFGCVCEVLGYGGRIMLYNNPFGFTGFMIQIILVTLGPAFFSAAIYFTLSRIVVYIGREYSRLSPKAYYWIFIPCDCVSLALQGTGGGMSSSSSGASHVAVDIAIAGLSFQVITLCVFIALSADFAIRARTGRRDSSSKMPLPRRFKVFVTFLSAAIVLILARCGYRIAELKGGYTGPGSELIRDQGLFIALEGVLIVISVYFLVIAHPGPVFEGTTRSGSESSLAEGGQVREMADAGKF
jgi:hypothetical protein